jgi:hypothetical protein
VGNRVSRTKVTEADVRKLMTTWVDRLRLTHWRIKVIIGDAGVEACARAEIDTSVDYGQATVRFADEWNEWAWDELEEVIVHELTHLHLHQLHMAALEAKPAFNKEAGKLYKNRVLHELEHAVDALVMVSLSAWGS